ncbi:AgmX/PglI C-terminal domain-containing protein [Haliangium sp.]|uniref:AgmX/PglI C-terminal domain-containing protein n=1 Tax=Haliangium sp. TaxID=2663208 RepID=UPI003D0F949C
MSPNPAHKERGEQPRVLRIGVVLGGKIIEEKVVRERRAITLGQSAQNNFTVPVEGLPRTWTLFELRDGHYELRFTDAMDGRLSEGREVLTFESLKHRARPVDGGYALSISDRARGKVMVGAMTLLFQFVDPPAPQAPVRLPPSVQGRFTDRIDPTLLLVLTISLLLHGGVTTYAYLRDRVVREPRMARVYNETFQRPTVSIEDTPFEQPTEPEPVAKQQEDQPKKSDEPERPARKQRSAERSERGDGGERSAEDALRLQAEAQAAVDALLGDDFSASGIGGTTSDRAPGEALTAAMASARARGVSSEFGTGGSRGTRGSSSTNVGTSQGPGVSGPGETTSGTDQKVAERVPRGRIKMGGTSSLDDTTLRPQDVLRRIQQVYMKGLTRCHRELLKREPGAGGTVTLRLTVGETGRVTRVKARGFDDGVDRCIEQRAGAWRFGVPKDDDGDPTSADFQVSLVLQPD